MVTLNQLIATPLPRLGKVAIRDMIVAGRRQYGSLTEVAVATGWTVREVERYEDIEPIPEMGGPPVADPKIADVNGRTPAAFEREINFSLARAAYAALGSSFSFRQLGDFLGYDARNIGRAIHGDGGADEVSG